MSIRAITCLQNRSPSVIPREVQRNRGRRYYKAVDTNNRAWKMAKRLKQCLLESNSNLRSIVIDKLELKWSPEQILGWLQRAVSKRKSMKSAYATIKGFEVIHMFKKGQFKDW